MGDEDIWIPLVDEPIGDLVAKVQADDPEIAALVAPPRRQLAFRTFAYIRVGLILGQLLVDEEFAPESSRTWVEDILRNPGHYELVRNEVKAVAREVAADPSLAEEEPAPAPEARERFRRFARRTLGREGGASIDRERR